MILFKGKKKTLSMSDTALVGRTLKKKRKRKEVSHLCFAEKVLYVQHDDSIKGITSFILSSPPPPELYCARNPVTAFRIDAFARRYDPDVRFPVMQCFRDLFSAQFV